MLRGFALLLAFQVAGEGIARWLSLPVPGNVIGMVLLLLALVVGVVEAQWLQEAVDLLLGNMALLFVPAGVGIMRYFDLIGREFWAIAFATLLSTFAVLAVTGHLTQLLNRRGGEQDA